MKEWEKGGGGGIGEREGSRGWERGGEREEEEEG